MAYDNSKEALRQESELLIILLKATNDYIKGLKPGSLGEFIAKDWAGSFEKLSNISVALAADDDKFRKTLTDEISLLADFLTVTQNKGFGESWAQLFSKDIEIAARLLSDGVSVKQ